MNAVSAACFGKTMEKWNCGSHLSFPSSSLGTTFREAPLRTAWASLLIGNGLMFDRRGSRASKTCVPKLELGNEECGRRTL